jgi:hypothetical protein
MGMSEERSLRQVRSPWQAHPLIFAALLLLLTVFSCFAVCLRIGLLGDDFTNIHLLSSRGLEMLLQGFSGSHMQLPFFGLHYRPALTIFYLFDFWLFGINPVGLHLSNLLWHCCASFLAFLAVLKILEAFGVRDCYLISLSTALIFAIHPFHCEVLTWWVAKNDIICASWYLLSVYLFLEGRQSRRRRPFEVGALLAFLIAISCKEVALSLPLLITVLLIMLDSKNCLIKRILPALKESAPFWLVLAFFWLVRWHFLGTCLGGYWGHQNGFNLELLQEHYCDLQNPLRLWFPVDTDRDIWKSVSGVSLSLIYAFSFFSFAFRKDLKENDWRNTIAALIFACLAFLILMLPVSFIWFPDANFENSRLLYLPVLLISLLLPLLLLAGRNLPGQNLPAEENLLARLPFFRQALWEVLSLALFTGILFYSSLHIQARWLKASQAFNSLTQSLDRRLSSLAGSKQLVLFDLPSLIDRAPLRIQFRELQDLLRPPFANQPNWEGLRSITPRYFGDREICNLSRLKEIVLRPDLYQLVYCKRGPEPNSLTFEDALLSDLRKPGAKEPLVLAALDQGVGKGGNRYSFIRLPRPITTGDFQFLTIRFKPRREGKNTLRTIAWKKPSMPLFILENHSRYIGKDTNEGSEQERVVHVGEIVDWLLCPAIDALEVVTDKDTIVDSVTLRSDSGLVPDFRAIGAENNPGNDGVVRSAEKDGLLNFQFDASKVPQSSSVRVEITYPFNEFCQYSHTFRDSSECRWRMKYFDINATSGQFTLSNHLGSPAWHQVRILARSKNGSMVGYSSDPVFVQSEPDIPPGS